MLAAALTLSLAVTAVAQQPSDLERAKAAFAAGANAYAAGDYLAAIQAIEAAYAISPLPAIAFSLAQAERKQYFVDVRPDRLERALALFRRYLSQEPRGGRREDAVLAVAQLESLLGHGARSGGVTAAGSEARATRLMIVCDVPGARISLDGGPFSASPLIREVTPGKHRVLVRATGYVQAEREVTAVAGELLLSELSLREQPSSLYVWAPAGADVYVDGLHVARGGERLHLPVAPGTHTLWVAQNGRRLERRQLRIERGRAHAEYVVLEPTLQRALSEYAFIAGGVALGAGLVWSTFAARAENEAQDFLIERDRGRATAAKLIAYEAAIVERNRFRTAATVGAAGALGLFVTGLFLRELDQPSLPGALPRGAQSARALTFAPTAALADLGASLELHF